MPVIGERNGEHDLKAETDLAALKFLKEEGLDLLAAFKQIDNVEVRQAVRQLVQVISRLGIEHDKSR